MAMPLRKKYSLDNEQIIINDKKKREEIKEVDEEELLSNHDNKNINQKQNKSLRKSLLNNNEKEKDDLYEDLYEDVNADENNEEEKSDLKKQTLNYSSSKSPKKDNMLNSKHGRGSIRNNMQNIAKAQKIFKNFKKLNIPELPLKKEQDMPKESKKININITNNFISNKYDSEINEEKNSSSNKINKSDSNKLILKSDDNNSNKSSVIMTNSNMNKIVSADRFKRIKKDKIYSKEKTNKKFNTLKNSLYDWDYFLPGNLVHNATIFAYYSKNDDEFGNKKITPEKKMSNRSEIKSMNNLILTSFYNKNSKYDVKLEEKNFNKYKK
jgi:hypothetical protein